MLSNSSGHSPRHANPSKLHPRHSCGPCLVTCVPSQIQSSSHLTTPCCSRTRFHPLESLHVQQPDPKPSVLMAHKLQILGSGKRTAQWLCCHSSLNTPPWCRGKQWRSCAGHGGEGVLQQQENPLVSPHALLLPTLSPDAEAAPTPTS